MHNKWAHKLFGIVLFLMVGCTSAPTATPQITETPFQNSAPESAPQTTPLPFTLPIPLTNTSTPPSTDVTSFPDSSLYSWNPVVTGLSRPIGITNAGDGRGILYVIEKAGVNRMVQNGTLLPDPFLDIRSLIRSSGGEQGLLGLAFHPNYTQNGFFYVDYTDINGNTVIAQFSNSSTSPQLIPSSDKTSQVILLQILQPYANHNGGQLAFGPDGYLYIGMGDGGSEGDPHAYGQSVQTLLAKILRIDVDHGDPYAIPTNNPYVNGGGLPEIWAIGLRNPWRFSFDSKTGDLYIGDVGQDLWEEIDFLPASFTSIPANFGWSIREGLHPYKNTPDDTGTPLIDPVYEYSHDLGCAVIGGYVYRGTVLPDFNGIYLMGDNCSGSVWGLIGTGDGVFKGQALFQTGLNISSFGVDESGEIYFADLGGGIYQLKLK